MASAYPRNWLVGVLITTTSGAKKRSISAPMFYKGAHKLQKEYEAMGHKSWLEKVPQLELEPKGILPYRNKE